MDFLLNENQQELAALSRRILNGQVTADRPDQAGCDGFDPALWAALARADILSAALPESVGGAGLGLLEQCSVLAEIGRAVAPAPYLESIVLDASAIVRFGTPDQQRQWAEPAGRGEFILTAALAEEDGDDPAAPSATAEPVPGGWLLSGVKTAVPAAPRAALMLVPARTPRGVAVFLVGPADAGVTVQRQQVTGGVSAGRLVLAGVELPGDRVLGGPEADPDITDWLPGRGTVGECALQLGVVERALEMTSEYARSRMQFGRPIGSFQAVAQRLADAFIDVEAVRLTMWRAAWRLSEGLPCDSSASTSAIRCIATSSRPSTTSSRVAGPPPSCAGSARHWREQADCWGN
ncbi:MAG TPA: acyl-CoA dehydrogenase family protein [Streptosporangiaceae bacterium]|nr:acyl-CoA dehydrogenase family protein [Streptosporangiaceae bacterium]